MLKEQYDDIVRLKSEGWSCRRIGVVAGFSATHVSRVLRDGGNGSGWKTLKFTPEIRAELFTRVKSGETVAQAARNMGLKRNSIYKWLKREGIALPRGYVRNLTVKLKPEIYSRLKDMAGARPVEYFVADILARSVADLK